MENQHVFIPFAFDTFCFLVPDTVELLNRVKQIMHNNVISSRYVDIVFKRISFTIEKGLAMQLVVLFHLTRCTMITKLMKIPSRI